MRKIRGYLLEHARPSEIEDLFWLEIPGDLLSATQIDHGDCRPHVFAVEVGESWVKAEVFVRSMQTMRCDCQQYGTEEQIHYLIRWMQSMIGELRIQT